MLPFGLVIAMLVVSGLSVAAIRRRWVLRRAKEPKPLAEYGGEAFRALEHQVLGPPPRVPDADQVLRPAPAIPATPALPAGSSGNAKRQSEGSQSDLSWLAIGDGVVPAAAYGLSWANVDPHLFQAVEHMTHETCTSIGELGRVISERGWEAGSWFGASQGLVTNVKGHLAEWLAADHLREAGHAVAMPLTSNQAGYDLIVDGNPVNVKSVEDVQSALHEHFSQYPDIALLIPGDALGIPSDALHFDPTSGLDIAAAKEAGTSVLVDSALSHAEATDMAQQGLDAAAGHLDAHIPWITVAVSGIREGKLLMKGNTDLLRAGKNILVDTAAVGGGAALGAKAGAALGTAFAPGVGTLIGGIIGGVGGALLGRKVSNEIKRAPLEEAKKVFEESVGRFETVRTGTVSEVEQQWTAFDAARRAELAGKSHEIALRAREALEAVRQDLEGKQKIPVPVAAELLAEAERELAAQLAQAEKAYREISWVRRWFWPTGTAAGAIRYRDALRAYHRRWCEVARELRARFGQQGDIDAAEVLSHVLATQSGATKARRFLFQTGLHRAASVQKAEAIGAQSVALALRARADVVEELKGKQKTLVAWAEEQLAGPLDALKTARANFVSELKKAGVEVSA